MMIRNTSPSVRVMATFLAGAVLHMATHTLSIGVGTAWAQGADKADRSVGLFVVPKAQGNEQDALVLQSILRGNMDKLRGVTLARTAPIRNADSVQRAGTLLDQAQKALATGSSADALKQAQSAWELLSLAQGAADDRLLALLMKVLGVASAMNGQPDDAYRYIRRSVLLWDNQSAAEYGYSLEARNIYDQVMADISTDPTGTLELSSIPAGAEVYVGGQLRGYTPITLTSLTAGGTYVQVAKDGYFHWADFVDVPVSGQGKADAILTPSPGKGAVETTLSEVTRSFQANKVNGPLMDLQSALGSTELIVLRATLVNGVTFDIDGWYMAKDGAVQPVTLQVARDASLLENLKLFLATQLATSYAPEPVRGPLAAPVGGAAVSGQPTGDEGELILDPNAPIFKKTGDGDEDAITNQWWFWTLIGVGVAGAATAIILPLTLGGDDSSGAGPTGSLNLKFGSY
ncbi:MAG: hypothetical protein AMXMBFR64_13780 [Myxococcales bacterium]